MELHNFSSGIFQLACPEKNLKDISKAKFWRGKEEKRPKKGGEKGKKKVWSKSDTLWRWLGLVENESDAHIWLWIVTVHHVNLSFLRHTIRWSTLKSLVCPPFHTAIKFFCQN